MKLAKSEGIAERARWAGWLHHSQALSQTTEFTPLGLQALAQYSKDEGAGKRPASECGAESRSRTVLRLVDREWRLEQTTRLFLEACRVACARLARHPTQIPGHFLHSFSS